ncbi:hypothetical protein HGRIS_004389 [Hohenbuehelia grisea]|uniref:C2H2-type domain-containing protein n=1 Tax=Hohenbuehelia grisea TaxID=104357 RepID=A0ABR3JBP9_9AGAR
MSASSTYARQLLGQKNGYPLWIPEPHGPSSVYRSKGVRIGDVGYITQDGGFRPLFNIRAPASHPVNRRGVPEGFEQTSIDPENLNFSNLYYPPNSTVASINAERRSLSGEVSTSNNLSLAAGAGASLTCSWSSSEGAILHLPRGGCRLSAYTDELRRQAFRHAINWYKFVVQTLDQPISNGSLYLVTGWDKAKSWMVGSFTGTRSSESQLSIHLSAPSVAGAQASYTYSWDSASLPQYRIGPDDGSEELIRPEDEDALAQDNEIFAGDAPDQANQCVFIRGYKISLKLGIMAQIRRGVPRVRVSSIEESKSTDVQHNWGNASLLKTFPSSSVDEYESAFIRPSNLGSALFEGNEGDASSTGSDSGSVVSVQSEPENQEPYHPSTVLNAFMLDNKSDASVAVIHDDDWAMLIGDDQILPTDDEIISRFRRCFKVITVGSVACPHSESMSTEFGGLKVDDRSVLHARRPSYRGYPRLGPGPSFTRFIDPDDEQYSQQRGSAEALALNTFNGTDQLSPSVIGGSLGPENPMDTSDMAAPSVGPVDDRSVLHARRPSYRGYPRLGPGPSSTRFIDPDDLEQYSQQRGSAEALALNTFNGTDQLSPSVIGGSLGPENPMDTSDMAAPSVGPVDDRSVLHARRPSYRGYPRLGPGPSSTRFIDPDDLEQYSQQRGSAEALALNTFNGTDQLSPSVIGGSLGPENPMGTSDMAAPSVGSLFRQTVTSVQTRQASLMRRKNKNMGKFLCDICGNDFTSKINLTRLFIYHRHS